MKKLKIGNVELDSPVILAPMAGVCDASFKAVVRELGHELISTEMVSDKALLYENKKTLKMIEIAPDEHPVALQLFGSEIDSMVKAAIMLDKETTCDIIDINFGCPAPKVVKNGGGSNLLKDPEYLYKLLKAIVDAVDKPVTAKIRLGWNDRQINAVEVAKLIEKAGAVAITVHGRTTKQAYTGKADWDMIKKVKEAVSIPVIGNGDVTSPAVAKDRMDRFGVDGIMVGRAAMGNPWILSRMTKYIETGVMPPETTIEEKLDMCLVHADKLIANEGEHLAMLKMRTHGAWYIKSIKKHSQIKRDMGQISTRDDLVNVLNMCREVIEDAE